mmetsp:Transcript_36270/g.6490  ORF Transcript_36270/g.6490 Transcript_36270/m.6490 type:complete len:136 (+) Transcript_36270:320-727(+)
MPVVVGSKFCSLYGMSPEDLIKHREDIQEIGGYFIVNGNEKIVRLLIVPKQNYPMSIYRPSFTKRGDGYTALAVQCRCVRDDLFTQTVTVHYISDGNCSLRVIMRRGEYFIPAIILLRALKNTSDYEIYSRLVHG